MSTDGHPSRRKNPRWVFTGILICVGWTAPVLAGTLTGVMANVGVTAIGTIVERPEAFHLQLIQVEGVVRDIEILKPHNPYHPGDPCPGAYLFSLAGCVLGC